jgi:hypothetical protein
MARAHVTLEIIGFACGGGGLLTVERALARGPGVVHAYVNPATETAVQPDALVDAVEPVGFRTGIPVLR